MFSSDACITALSRKVGIEGIKRSFHFIFDGLRIHEVVVKIPFIVYYVFLSADNSVCVHTHTHTHTHTEREREREAYVSNYGCLKSFACNLLFRDIKIKIIQLLNLFQIYSIVTVTT